MGRGGTAAHRHAAAHLPAGRVTQRFRRPGSDALTRRRTPERLPGLVDSHCHLQDAAFDADREQVIDRARQVGIARIMVPGWDVPSSEAALELAARHPDIIDAAVGVHPHYAAAADEAAWGRIEAMAAQAGGAAIGEIGLDFHRNLSPPAAQREAFGRQLAIARSVGKPVLVHDREAHDAIGEALTTWAGPAGRAHKGVMHAFSGDAALATGLAASGFLISFALPVAFRSARGPRAAAGELPATAILVETDAPYLGPDRERRNEPTTALRVVTELAHLRSVEVTDLAASIGANYARLLRA